MSNPGTPTRDVEVLTVATNTHPSSLFFFSQTHDIFVSNDTVQDSGVCVCACACVLQGDEGCPCKCCRDRDRECSHYSVFHS